MNKIPENQPMKPVFFVNSALKIQCNIVKNTLLQTAFSAIFPTGIEIHFILNRFYFADISKSSYGKKA